MFLLSSVIISDQDYIYSCTVGFGHTVLFAKVFYSFQGRGTFPCEISVLEIHQDLDWNPKVSTLNVWPLYICDDGAVIFYRYAIFLCLQ